MKIKKENIELTNKLLNFLFLEVPSNEVNINLMLDNNIISMEELIGVLKIILNTDLLQTSNLLNKYGIKQDYIMLQFIKKVNNVPENMIVDLMLELYSNTIGYDLIILVDFARCIKYVGNIDKIYNYLLMRNNLEILLRFILEIEHVDSNKALDKIINVLSASDIYDKKSLTKISGMLNNCNGLSSDKLSTILELFNEHSMKNDIADYIYFIVNLKDKYDIECQVKQKYGQVINLKKMLNNNQITAKCLVDVFYHILVVGKVEISSLDYVYKNVKDIIEHDLIKRLLLTNEYEFIINKLLDYIDDEEFEKILLKYGSVAALIYYYSRNKSDSNISLLQRINEKFDNKEVYETDIRTMMRILFGKYSKNIMYLTDDTGDQTKVLINVIKRKLFYYQFPKIGYYSFISENSDECESLDENAVKRNRIYKKDYGNRKFM